MVELAPRGRHPVDTCVAAFQGEYVAMGTDEHGTPRSELRQMVLKGWRLPPRPGDESFEEHMEAVRATVLCDPVTGAQLEINDAIIHNPMIMFKLQEAFHKPTLLFSLPLSFRFQVGNMPGCRFVQLDRAALDLKLGFFFSPVFMFPVFTIYIFCWETLNHFFVVLQPGSS